MHKVGTYGTHGGAGFAQQACVFRVVGLGFLSFGENGEGKIPRQYELLFTNMKTPQLGPKIGTRMVAIPPPPQLANE